MPVFPISQLGQPVRVRLCCGNCSKNCIILTESVARRDRSQIWMEFKWETEYRLRTDRLSEEGYDSMLALEIPLDCPMRLEAMEARK